MAERPELTKKLMLFAVDPGRIQRYDFRRSAREKKIENHSGLSPSRSLLHGYFPDGYGEWRDRLVLA